MDPEALEFAAWDLPAGTESPGQVRADLAGLVTELPGLFPSPLSRKLARQTLEASKALEGPGSLGLGVYLIDGSRISGAARFISAFGILPRALPWASRDGSPARLVWLLLAKEGTERSASRNLAVYFGSLLGDAGLVEALGGLRAAEAGPLFQQFVEFDLEGQKAQVGGNPAQALKAWDKGLALVPASDRLAQMKTQALSQAGGASGYEAYKRKAVK